MGPGMGPKSNGAPLGRTLSSSKPARGLTGGESKHGRMVVKISYLFCVLGLALATLHVTGGQASAQLEVSGAGSLLTVPNTGWGIGGRVGFPIRETLDRGVRLEGTYDYYWVSCTTRDCKVSMGNLNVIVQNRFGGQALGYFGVGATYEDYAIFDNGFFTDDTGWGANLVLGSRTQTQDAFRPFVEARWILISDIRNQFQFTLGGVFVLGS